MAFKTLARASRASLRPGDSVLLKRGQKWNESLNLSVQGSSDAPISIGAFGHGARPILSGAVDITDGPWTKVKEKIWVVGLQADGGKAPERVFVEGRSFDDHLRRANSSELQSNYEWIWSEENGGTFFLFSDQSPAELRKRIEVNVRRRGIMLGTKNYVRIEGLHLTRFREGIWMGGSGCSVSDVVSDENSFTGITVTGSSNELRNFETSRNGVDLTPGDTDAHGLGVLVDGAHNLLRDFTSNDNSEDGVQTGPKAGSGNRFLNAMMKGNRENCFDIKSGDQFIEDGVFISDAEKSADCILVHKVPHRVVIRGVRASSTTKGPALHVMQGATVDVSNSWFRSDESSAILVGQDAGNGTKIMTSIIDGGGRKSKFLIEVRSGKNHEISRNKLSVLPGTKALFVAPGVDVKFDDNTVNAGK